MMRVAKFLTTGAIGISVNLSVFHVCVRYLGIPYLIGSIAGLGISMVVGFILQKFWTFEQKTASQIHTQFLMYVSLALFNLTLNTGVVFILVDYSEAHYLIAQAIGAAVVACISFFVYRGVIFKQPTVN